jgi:integrase
MFQRRRYRYVYRDVDRYGVIRYYYRPHVGAGHPKVRMPDDPNSEEFAARYRELVGDAGAMTLTGRALTDNTFRGLVDDYIASGTFKRLDKLTQDKRRQILDACCAEPVVPDRKEVFAIFPLSRLQTKHLEVLRDRKEHVPNAQVNRVKTLKALFKWATAKKKVPINPARDLTVEAAPAGGHHSWTPDEVRQFEERHPIGTKARMALALMLWTGVRRSDLVNLGKQHVRDGWLRFTQQKNRKRRPVQIAVPILPELQKVIDASPTGDLTFLVTSAGAPYTMWGFGNWFRDRCVEAGVPGRAHGLRKAGAATAAENGATTKQLMAIFGWLTLEQAELYVRAAEKEKLARDAMGFLVRRR